MSTTAQKQLLALSQKLPAEKIREVVDFAEFLLARTPASTVHAAKNGRAGHRYLGRVKHGGLASGIDDELYGQPVR